MWSEPSVIYPLHILQLSCVCVCTTSAQLVPHPLPNLSLPGNINPNPKPLPAFLRESKAAAALSLCPTTNQAFPSSGASRGSSRDLAAACCPPDSGQTFCSCRITQAHPAPDKRWKIDRLKPSGKCSLTALIVRLPSPRKPRTGP